MRLIPVQNRRLKFCSSVDRFPSNSRRAYSPIHSATETNWLVMKICTIVASCVAGCLAATARTVLLVPIAGSCRAPCDFLGNY